jgi:hypothetical protein
VTAPIETPPAVHVINRTRINSTQTLYQLSTPVAQTVIGKDFLTEHVIVSHGSHGDTAIFPAGPEGQVLDLLALYGQDYHQDADEAVREWLEGEG